jgi:GxxExxY protein
MKSTCLLRNYNGMELLHADITRLVIQAFFQVHNDLGYGFLERVYQRSMAIAARSLGLSVMEQWPIHVHYGGTVVGEYFADMLSTTWFSSRSRPRN